MRVVEIKIREIDASPHHLDIPRYLHRMLKLFSSDILVARQSGNGDLNAKVFRDLVASTVDGENFSLKDKKLKFKISGADEIKVEQALHSFENFNFRNVLVNYRGLDALDRGHSLKCIREAFEALIIRLDCNK